jgi:phosphoribosylanthranilate isomerase
LAHLLKICCIQSLEEARLAIREGATHIGLLPAATGGERAIPEERAAAIAAATRGLAISVLVTHEREVPALLALLARCPTDALQLARPLAPEGYAALRAGAPGVTLIQSVHVDGPSAIDVAREVMPHVEVILLDSGRADGSLAELGSTGRVHDWQISRAIVAACDRPVLLAGGLHPENVAEAMRVVGPAGVDICTGVRDGARLAGDRVRAVREALDRTPGGERRPRS